MKSRWPDRHGRTPPRVAPADRPANRRVGGPEPFADPERLGAALDELDAALRGVGIPLTAECRAQCAAYLETLLLWRQSVSLTTAATPVAIVRDHVVDSLTMARFARPGMRIADVGSGAGFPGVPVAIVCPAVRMALIEPRRKRANFLRDVVRRAGLINVEVFEARVEAHVATRARSYDLVVSRAFGALGEFLHLVAPLLDSGGLAVAMKGPRGEAEAAATAVPGYTAREVVRYTLRSGAEHLLLIYRRQ